MSTGNQYIEINRGVRQGCPLSPTLFNLYIDHITREWKSIAPKGVKINKHYSLNMLLFADDQVLIAPDENTLQLQIHLLDQIITKYDGKISTQKTKVMAHYGKDAIRTKIILRDKPLEQISNFNYLGCDITYNKEKDYIKKINKFQSVCGTISKTFKNKARLDTQTRLYNILAIPVVLYGSEAWTTTKLKEQRLRTAEMAFLRKIKGLTREDRVRNTIIRSELKITPLEEKVQSYKQKWREHVTRMPAERLPQMLLKYKAPGKRSTGRPIKRW